MAVQMVIGNSLNWFPTGPFQGVCTLTTLIVSEMPYSAGLWNQALLAVGFILLCFIHWDSCRGRKKAAIRSFPKD